MNEDLLQDQLEHLPVKAGVYLFRDCRHKVIYIGKAKNLKSRVRSYFQPRRFTDHKTGVLRQHISDLEYIVTDNEVEAVFLESNLVKKHKPQFNVNLKDDKAFLHIKLTIHEPYPRVLLTRRVLHDGALYFGPYTPASLARNTVKIINRHFLLRTCDLSIDGSMDRPCLEHHIKRCLGPCVDGLCTPDEYSQAVKEVILLLEGKNEELIGQLTQRMRKASERQHYEAAAFYRDRLRMVRDLAKKQKMILTGAKDVDIFAYYREGSRLALQLFTLRKGKIVGKREFFWSDLNFFDPAQFVGEALQQYYLTSRFIPHQIYLPVRIRDQDLIARWLSRKFAGSKKERTVRILVPQKGGKYDLLLLVERNAKVAFEGRFKILRSEKDKLLERLQSKLDLPQIPRRIEAFDISNIQGVESVASMVVCQDGVMKKSEYRQFKLREVQGANDCASIYEVVHRRYHRLLEEGQKLPDLILIDGGKGQLHFAYQALSELAIEDTPLVSIAKREEQLFVQGQEDPLILENTSIVLHLLQEIRDEAHRFALSFHRKRRSLKDFASELNRIPGIGDKRKKRLLRNFGSVTRIGRASVAELTPFVGQKLARQVKEALA